MVAAKKTKKAQESINSRLALVMKSGKYTLGYKTTLKTLRSGKVRQTAVALKRQPLLAMARSRIECHALLSSQGPAGVLQARA